MIIIAGNELVSRDERDATVDAFRDLVARARKADGCVHVAITADSVTPERINTIEIWRDAEALDRWRARAAPPQVAEPTHMDVRRYAAQDGGVRF